MGVSYFIVIMNSLNTFISLSLILTGVIGAPDMRFTCDECVDEMRKLEWMMNDAAEPIRDYLIANYCPTLDDGQALCGKDLADGYVKMLTEKKNKIKKQKNTIRKKIQ